ncbi:MAG TPA: hypothetical protein PLN93_01785 [Vicinamibacterales bacterium]|nr:hypothetical protein [Vicinamibacterales bacterium]HOQ60544.1 hypothetical protein [Vicinamibacterales bacterium]HPK70644.1 hypothetical protein [Vicinamibacterales bacterium]
MGPTPRRPTGRAGFAALLACLAIGAASGGPLLRARQPAPPSPRLSDLDAFMARVLERRNDNWKTLHDYILSERERFQVLGPGSVPLVGQRRDFIWFIRDGFLVRSPITANGVAIAETDRREYEAAWLAGEQAREKRAREKREGRAGAAEAAAGAAGSAADAAIVEGLGGIEPLPEREAASMVGGEPRFISEAYFMKFRFEPGNYYLAGRETLDGRPVVKVEYYPSRMFDGEDKERREKTEVRIDAASGEVSVRPAEEKPAPAKRRAAGQAPEDDDLDREIEAAMNKVTQVTMWIDPQEFQIVKYTIDNADWGFLPGRSIVRVDEARASMTMGRYFDGVWLPNAIVFRFGATFAAGSYTLLYTREFHDYRRGEVSARIRAYVPREP